MLSSSGGEALERTLLRFEREAQATASLMSPNTIRLYDFGTADNGSFYYVMELLDGLDLEALIDRHGPQPVERTIFLLQQVCRSLAEAHESGLIHRDIKPANIFTCRYGIEHDFVKVLDFGLVKHREGGEQDLRITTAGLAGGTPAYMAPEQALGWPNLDGRADLYALGCVAYWLLTGSTVFAAESTVEMLTQHLHTKPDPPSAHTEIRVPPDLDEIVLRCLAKSPEDRPQSALEFADVLASIDADATWSEDRAARWWNEHRPVSATARRQVDRHRRHDDEISENSIDTA
jgi:serine/threonine-protein kinase